MRKLICGVGVNDADYCTETKLSLGYVNGKRKCKTIWTCPIYSCWRRMLSRCYSEKVKARNPSYGDVTCCDEWHTFSKFKLWMEKQNYQGKDLDKDILIAGNKLYSPDTSVFVSHLTNGFIVACDAARGEWPLGVDWHKVKKKFRSFCRNPFTKKIEYLGYFTNPEDAHEAWRKRKHELAQLVAETETDERVIEALKKRYLKEEWYK